MTHNNNGDLHVKFTHWKVNKVLCFGINLCVYIRQNFYTVFHCYPGVSGLFGIVGMVKAVGIVWDCSGWSGIVRDRLGWSGIGDGSGLVLGSRYTKLLSPPYT